MNDEYVARKAGALWAVATSTQVICNYLSEDLAPAISGSKRGIQFVGATSYVSLEG